MTQKIYDYIIVGAGVSGSCIAFELFKHTSNILLIDKLDDVSSGASGAAGAFLSPLLGKPNKFKDLVNKALVYSTQFYTQNTSDSINNCGTVRIPKDDKDKEKFQSYKPFFIEFDYEEKEQGYYFPIASVVDGYDACKTLTQDIEKLFNYEVKSIIYNDDYWLINNQIMTKNIIISSGASIDLIGENYFNIRPVWGQRIVCKTSTCIDVNYHKECSLAQSKKIDINTYITSIGATHHRNVYEKEINNIDTQELLKKANNIKKLEDIEVIDAFAGARASSVDYFPMVGELIDSSKTLEEFPYLKHGTHVKSERFTKYKNLYVINGVGGRGFVLAPYLASKLCEMLFDDRELDNDLKVDRLFLRWVKKA